MAKIFKLRPKAEEDLIEIYTYSAREWGIPRADQYIRDIESIFQNLADNNTIGRDRSYIRPRLRSYPAESHLIYYKPTSFGVAIIRVLHSSMNPKYRLR